MKYTWIFALALFVIACTNEDSPADVSTVDSLAVEDSVVVVSAILPWVSDYDTVKNEFYLKQQRQVNPDSVTAASLVEEINANWENVKLVLVKTSNDTLYVSIPDADYLAQQMGSAGAQAYMASTTYNLTELKGIKYVNYQLQAGDHAAPGTLSRKSFENYR